MKKLILIYFIFILCVLNLKAQDTLQSKVFDEFAFGYGVGLPYGGGGINIIGYPYRNLGFFGGAGFTFPGVGYNIGAKYRLRKLNQKSNLSPFAVVMYGSNSGTRVRDYKKYNKNFYGPSIGMGLDFGPKSKDTYITFSAIYSFRDSEFYDYVETLKSRTFKFTEIYPVTISFGFVFILTRHDYVE